MALPKQTGRDGSSLLWVPKGVTSSSRRSTAQGLGQALLKSHFTARCQIRRVKDDRSKPARADTPTMPQQARLAKSLCSLLTLSHPEGPKFILWIEIEPAKRGIWQLLVSDGECRCGGAGAGLEPTSLGSSPGTSQPPTSMSHTMGTDSSASTPPSHTEIPMVSGKSWAALRTFTCPVDTPRDRVREEQDQSKKARQRGGIRSQAMPSCKAMPACSR